MFENPRELVSHVIFGSEEDTEDMPPTRKLTKNIFELGSCKVEEYNVVQSNTVMLLQKTSAMQLYFESNNSIKFVV